MKKDGKKWTARRIKTLKRKAWEATSKFVRERDKYKCVTCGRKGNHCGHYQRNSERKADLGGNELWYDLRNLNCQCVVCNNYESGNLANYALFLERKHGKGVLQELNKLYNKPKKWTPEELEEIIKKLSTD